VVAIPPGFKSFPQQPIGLVQETAAVFASQTLSSTGIWPLRDLRASIVPTAGGNNSSMAAAKLSVSIPRSLVGFVETYRKTRGLKSRSQVFEEAIKLLRNRELEAAYRAANSEIEDVWDGTLSDGLSDETW